LAVDGGCNYIRDDTRIGTVCADRPVAGQTIQVEVTP